MNPLWKAGPWRTHTTGGTCLGWADGLSSHNSWLLSPIWVSGAIPRLGFVPALWRIFLPDVYGERESGTFFQLFTLTDISPKVSKLSSHQLLLSFPDPVCRAHEAAIIESKPISTFSLHFLSFFTKTRWQRFAHKWDSDLFYFCVLVN